VVPLELERPLRDGEVLYAMLHRDNGNGRFDSLLVDGYEQIESLDVVEIDPRTTALSADYFHLNIHDPRLRIFNEDGRTFINRRAESYDIIYVDAFQSFYGIPWQLTTVEAVRRLHARLHENGVVVVNVPSALEGPSSKLFQAELKTYLAVFPEVRTYAVTSTEERTIVQNIILVAFKNKDTIRTSANDDKEINEQLTHEWRGSLDPNTQILTDDFAPTDYYTNVFADLHNF
jgi:spermidine synthase